jgi:hypothetical protein
MQTGFTDMLSLVERGKNGEGRIRPPAESSRLAGPCDLICSTTALSALPRLIAGLHAAGQQHAKKLRCWIQVPRPEQNSTNNIAKLCHRSDLKPDTDVSDFLRNGNARAWPRKNALIGSGF